MSATQTRLETTVFDLFNMIADTLGGPARKAWPGVPAPAMTAPSSAPASKRPGLLGRLGERLWRHQLRSVDLQLARSDDLFANLDRWLWKQHQRETEAWLAQSTDVHDLEARIRHLERNRDGRIF
jgi:hypothetical protein